MFPFFLTLHFLQLSSYIFDFYYFACGLNAPVFRCAGCWWFQWTSLRQTSQVDFLFPSCPWVTLFSRPKGSWLDYNQPQKTAQLTPCPPPPTCFLTSVLKYIKTSVFRHRDSSVCDVRSHVSNTITEVRLQRKGRITSLQLLLYLFCPWLHIEHNKYDYLFIYLFWRQLFLMKAFVFCFVCFLFCFFWFHIQFVCEKETLWHECSGFYLRGRLYVLWYDLKDCLLK